MLYDCYMKIIRVSDVIHESLKREARQQGRTLQWLADEKLSRPLESYTNVTSSVDLETARAMNPQPAVGFKPGERYTPPAPPIEIGTWQEVDPKTENNFSETLEWCDEHDSNPEQCKNLPHKSNSTAGEKPCCNLKKPCQHWYWEEVEQNWVNTLSGRARDE